LIQIDRVSTQHKFKVAKNKKDEYIHFIKI